MSVVTGVMLVIGPCDWDEAPLAEVQDWLHRRDYPVALRDVADHSGGNKHPQFEAWCAGINGFVDEDEFAEFVLTRSWDDPENFVLILQPEHGPTRVFTMVDSLDGGAEINPPLAQSTTLSE